MVWCHPWTICLTVRKQADFCRFWRRSTKGQTEMGRPHTAGDLFSPSEITPQSFSHISQKLPPFQTVSDTNHMQHTAETVKSEETHTHTQTHAYRGLVCICARAPRHTHTHTQPLLKGWFRWIYNIRRFVSHSKDVKMSAHPLQNRRGEAVKPTNDARCHLKADKSGGEAEGASSQHGACRPGPPAVLCLRW